LKILKEFSNPEVGKICVSKNYSDGKSYKEPLEPYNVYFTKLKKNKAFGLVKDLRDRGRDRNLRNIT